MGIAHVALLALQVVVQVPVVNSDVAQARATAMQEAFVALIRQAVTNQTGGTTASTGAIPPTVATAARTYVERYRVLDEREEQGTLRLVVEGDVATGRLTRALGLAPAATSVAPLVFEDAVTGTVRGTGLVGAQVRARSSDVQFEAWGFAADPTAARIAARRQAETQAALRRPAAGMSLIISDIDGPVKLEQLRAALANRVPGVQRAMLTRIWPGRFEFWLTTATVRSPLEVARALVALDFEGFALELRSQSPLRMAMVVQ